MTKYAKDSKKVDFIDTTNAALMTPENLDQS